MTFPVRNGRITNGFLTRAYTDSNGVYHPVHLGIDIAPAISGTTGVPCVAPEGGSVVRSAYIASLEGNYVIIQSATNRFYYFGHFASRNVVVGQKVSEGQQIGILGKTGSATGIHTHFEIRSSLTGGQTNPAIINWNSGGVTTMSFTAEQIKNLADAGGIKQTAAQLADGATKPSFEVALNFIKTVQQVANQWHYDHDQLKKQLEAQGIVLAPGKYIVQ